MAKLPSQKDNFPAWYNELIQLADLAEVSASPGSYIIKPYGYAIWEMIRDALDKRIKESETQNAYFPLFIPESFLNREKEHIDGFSPELAVVTHGGGKKLTENLVVRPTSETIIYDAFSKWISSYRDLPLKINQWANVVRWEMRPRPFLRSREFLWQEGHTAHATDEDAETETKRALKMYEDFDREDLAIPVITGKKSESEKFAGAKYTLTTEALARDGKAIQAGTSHHLGQNFSKSFNIKFLGNDEKEHFAHQASWGVSFRILGTMIMIHGDQKGLRIPPNVAPIQAVIIPIQGEGVLEKLAEIEKNLKSKIRIKIDGREEKTPGFKFNEWEVKGVPLRIEIGPRDAKENSVVIARRDTGEKMKEKIDNLEKVLPKLLDQIQENLLKEAKKYLEENIWETKDYNDFKSIIKEKGGFINTFWCGDENCEIKVKNDTKATIRCLPFESQKSGDCIICGKKGEEVYFARAY